MVSSVSGPYIAIDPMLNHFWLLICAVSCD